MKQTEIKKYVAIMEKLFADGKRYSEVAEFLDWSYGRTVSFSIRHNLKQADELQWKRDKKKRNTLYKSIVLDLKSGIKQCDIARKYNVSKQYVSQIKLENKNERKES